MFEVARTVAAFVILVGLCWWVTGTEDASLLDRAKDLVAFYLKVVAR